MARWLGRVLVALLLAEVSVRALLLLPGVAARLAFRLGPRSAAMAWMYDRSNEDFGASWGYDPRLGWAPVPGERTGDGHLTVVGPAGLRGRRDHAPTPPPGVLRVALLGDSFVFGSDGDEDAIFPALLDRTPGVEALNLGVPGYGWGQVWLRWERDGRPRAPQVVVIGVGERLTPRCVEDFGVYAKPLVPAERGRFEPDGVPVPRPDALTLRLALTPHLAHVAEMWRWTLGEPARAEVAAARGEALLGHLVADVARSRATPVLLFLPTPWGLDDPPRVEQAWMDLLCGPGPARCVDPTPALRALRDGGVAVGRGTHYAPEAHAVVAEAVLGVLGR